MNMARSEAMIVKQFEEDLGKYEKAKDKEQLNQLKEKLTNQQIKEKKQKKELQDQLTNKLVKVEDQLKQLQEEKQTLEKQIEEASTPSESLELMLKRVQSSIISLAKAEERYCYDCHTEYSTHQSLKTHVDSKKHKANAAKSTQPRKSASTFENPTQTNATQADASQANDTEGNAIPPSQGKVVQNLRVDVDGSLANLNISEPR